MVEESKSQPDLGEPPSETLTEDQFRELVYQLMSNPDITPQKKLQRLLDFGREKLGVENGHIVKIDRGAGRHRITTASGSDLVQADGITDLDKTFCRETIAMDSIFTIYNPRKQGWEDDPAVETWNIYCYIGTKLLLGEGVYGTLCFVDSDPRDDQFTTKERSIVDFLGASIGRLLERDRHETELRWEREQFQLFVEEITDYAILKLDPAGHVISWNKGAKQIEGYSEEEIIGEHFGRFYPEDDRETGRPERLLNEARQTGRVEDEGWRTRKDGSTFWALVSIIALYDDDGTLRGFGEVTRDLTDRRNAQRALEAEREFIKRALNALDDIFFVLTSEGSIDRVNQRLIDVTGYPEHEIPTVSPEEFFIPEDREKITEAIAEALETGETTVEATLLTENEERRHYEFRARRLTDEDGSVTGVVGIGRDITERLLYEERLEVAQRVLRHNLRNDLTVVRGWVERFGEAATGTEADAVDGVLSTIEQLIELSEETYQMAQLDPVADDTHATVDVTERLPEIVGEFSQEFPEAHIELELPEGDRLLLVTDDRFEMAVSKVIRNAIEHNPAGAPWVAVDVRAVDGQIEIAIHDDGPGIPETERRVLETGEETPLEHGSGMGLWLTRWCVTMAGGEITMNDRDPSGSTVTLCFPIRTDP